MTKSCKAVAYSIASAVLSLAILGSTVEAASVPVSPMAAALTSQFGTIKGKLVWGGAEVPAQKVDEPQGKASKDPDVCAKNAPILSKDLVVDPKTKGVAYAFAYVVKPKGQNPAALAGLIKANPKVVMDQKNCEFMPHCVAINKGQTMVFKSSDTCAHNVRYSGFNNNAFNQNIPPESEVERQLVAERLPMPVACDIHPWMKSYVMVFDHPFFAVTKEDGSFEIKGVPAGAQKIVLWQEKTGFVTPNKAAGMAVQVKADEVVDLGEILMGK